jgi:hypothetical protein
MVMLDRKVQVVQ